jgi:hypothetical protein
VGSIGFVSSQINLTQTILTGALSLVNTTNLSIRSLTSNSWIGDIITPASVITAWNLDGINITSAVAVNTAFVDCNFNAIQLNALSTFNVKTLSNGLDLSNSSVGAFSFLDGVPGPINCNFTGLNVTSFLTSGLSGARNIHITNMTSSGIVTIGGGNNNTGNTISGLSCTSFTFGNSGALGDWSIDNVISNGPISIGGNVRNCHFSNLNGTTISLATQNCTFDGIQTEGGGTLTVSSIDNTLSNIHCTDDFTLSGSNNSITGVGFGQNDTLPLFLITGHRNCISNVNALGINNSGINFICRGSGNSISNYYTSGTFANSTQNFVVTGSNNKFTNVQLGALNDIAIQSMNNAASTITISGDYTVNRLTIGEYITVSNTPSNDGLYRITALVGGATTTLTVSPAPPINSAVVGTLTFPDVAVPPQVAPPGNGPNSSRPFGTVGSAGTNIGNIEFGGSNNHYTNIDITPRSWFDTVLNPAPPPILLDVYRGVLIRITSSLSHYTNLTIYKDLFHFTSPIPSPPAPNNAVPFPLPLAFQNVAVTGELNRFSDCRIGPVANTSGGVGFGTFDASNSPATSRNSILGSMTMVAPLGAFGVGAQWIQTSYIGADGINNVY